MLRSACKSWRAQACTRSAGNLPPDNNDADWCGKLVEAVERTGRQYMLGRRRFGRRRCSAPAEQPDFGEFVYAEDGYVHDVDAGCNRATSDVITRPVSSAASTAFMKKQDQGAVPTP